MFSEEPHPPPVKKPLKYTNLFQKIGFSTQVHLFVCPFVICTIVHSFICYLSVCPFVICTFLYFFICYLFIFYLFISPFVICSFLHLFSVHLYFCFPFIFSFVFCSLLLLFYFRAFLRRQLACMRIRSPSRPQRRSPTSLQPFPFFLVPSILH
jgi:hypothetical protein